ncbi:phosphoribosylanthranilate isomerase [Microvirga brassicacearum]|uniref:N-(5'-phosphoribosyl)anthranilate isomerase n=1 Tax=Microvirga brassicacearum TaxID=2580413 RepID=A0A5N3PF98_9HYPH|nr:phosphoribosylanthranilate isomerase [Microvirga brassicacearum]KAB0268383.1 phosphoribosylanthranilate isomerase [Microvirga brassicacearum]
MDRLIKICGLSTPETLDAALASGADLVGFVRFAKSPRHVDLDTGRTLSHQAKGRAQRVVLLVDPDDAAIAEAIEALDPDMLQLHGAETPTRVAAIRARFGRPVLKAIGVADAGDLATAADYAGIADYLLLDAKPPRTGDALPGGNGLPFDWTLLAGLDPALAFMLSGGLEPQNVAEAIRLARPDAVDVSSGVESRPGIKDPDRIEAFIRAARAAFAASPIEK